MDPGRRLVHGRLPRGYAHEAEPGRARSRPARVPAEPRRTQRMGELQGARDLRYHAGHARSCRRSHRTRRRRRTHRRAPGGCDEPGRTAHAAGDAERPRGGAACRAALPSLARHHGLAGRDRRRLVPHAGGLSRVRGKGRADRQGHRLALVGSPPRRGAGRRDDPDAGAQLRRPFPSDQRQDHAGRRHRELHRGRSRAVPRTRPASPPTTAACRSSTPSC